MNHDLNDAYTMTPDGTDVRFFYHGPSHHSWRDDDHLLATIHARAQCGLNVLITRTFHKCS